MISEKIGETAVFALAFECGFQLGSSEIIDILARRTGLNSAASATLSVEKRGAVILAGSVETGALFSLSSATKEGKARRRREDGSNVWVPELLSPPCFSRRSRERVKSHVRCWSVCPLAARVVILPRDAILGEESEDSFVAETSKWLHALTH